MSVLKWSEVSGLYLCRSGQRKPLLAPVEDLHLSGECSNCDSYALSPPSEQPLTKKSSFLFSVDTVAESKPSAEESNSRSSAGECRLMGLGGENVKAM